MTQHRCTVLLTGFGPFPGVPHNVSATLVEAVGDIVRRRFPSVRIETAALATEWQTAPAETAMLIAKLKPRIALHFGVSDIATGFVVETLARNEAGRVDAAGLIPEIPVIDPFGPQAMSTNLPAARIAARLRRLGLPARLSRDAGTYLCNAVFYRSMLTQTELNAGGRSGFIHLPVHLSETSPSPGSPRPRPVANRRRTIDPRLSFEAARDGGLEIIAACLATGHASPHASRAT